MKKIIYLTEEIEVNLNDILKRNGVSFKVTEEFITLNPELFKVENVYPLYFKCIEAKENASYTTNKIYKQYDTSRNNVGIIKLINDNGNEESFSKWDNANTVVGAAFEFSNKEDFLRQELLAKAKRDYPVGTKFKGLSVTGMTYIIEDDYLQWSKYSPQHITCGPKGVIIYSKNEDKWAEIITPKFTSEDDVKIYDNMKTWVVCKDLKLGNHSNYFGACKDYKYFYHKENALAYIEKHKEKTLEDYEKILLGNISAFTLATERFYFSSWGWLKDNEPKLYYTKILQLIADDLNDGWKPDFNNERQKKYFIDTLGVKVHCSVNYGLVYFKSMCLTQKARDILGSKIKYLFN